MTFDSSQYDEADFDAEFFEYARRALEMAGIATDETLKREKPIQHSMLHALSEQGVRYQNASKMVPRSQAHWEIARFAGIAVDAVIWDLQWGSIRNFAQFDYLYRRILGEQSRVFLPMIFAAAVWSPVLDREFAAGLLRTMPDRQWDELFD